MIFHHLKYITPVWYFNLKPSIDNNYFPTKEDLESQSIYMDIDIDFISDEGRQRDLAYRAFQRGFIAQGQTSAASTFWNTPKLPPEDEYRFLRKNFNTVWSIYVLLLRLLGFKSPIKEIRGYIRSRNSKRQLYHNDIIKYDKYDSFQSDLVNHQPLVSIIIPTLNRYAYLKDVFRDLEKQSYKNFEVIVVDQTDQFDDDVYKGWDINLKYWFQPEKALWKARNEAIVSAKGDFILLYDDDSLISEDWIEQHLKALDFFRADLSSGVSISKIGDKVPSHYSYFRWSDQLDTGNVLLKREIFNAIGFFDTKFERQRMGDGEYGLRAYLAGYRNISNPMAKRIHLKVGEGGLRQMGSWDGWRPKKFFGPRPVPSILYFFRKYHGNALTRWLMLGTIPLSLVPYKFKGNRILSVVGAFFSLIIFPIVICQVWASWKKSTEMLKS